MSSALTSNRSVFEDVIYGCIEIHPLCIKIIYTPHFQRLRFIKQLGLGYFVYPSASHHRLDHSIGVSYLAGLFARSLRDRQPELQITDKDVLCVEIAGLCHDLGHGPFSHLWEGFMKRVRPHVRWKHEATSVTMFDHLIESNHLEDDLREYDLGPDDVTFIKEMIFKPRGQEKDSTTWPYKGRPRAKGFLYQIVANDVNGIDVDKWDYLNRDIHSLGLQVMFNYSRLMKFARVINKSTSASPDLRICFRDKDAVDVYDMFHDRFTLHKKAYQHRVAKTLASMLLDALELANTHITYSGKNGIELPLSEVIDDMEAMTYLNDEIFTRIQRSTSTNSDMIKARNIIQNILNRRLYPYVGRIVARTDNLQPQDILQKLTEKIPSTSRLRREDFLVQLVLLNYCNGKDNPLQNVGFYTKEEPNVYVKYKHGVMSMPFPSNWEERIFQVLCRSYDDDALPTAKTAFSELCNQLSQPNRPSTGNSTVRYENREIR